MSCNSNNKVDRPDRKLQNTLVTLAYSLMALTASIIFLIIYPQYIFYTIPTSLLLVFLSLYLTLRTLKAGEDAINYGGFANEIIKNEFEGRRIDNLKSQPILQNSFAKDFFKNGNILDFLEKNLSENRNNKNLFNRLKTAFEQLREETVILSLNPHKDNPSMFNYEEWFEVQLKPISLNKTDIFESPFSIRTIRKDTYIFWSIKDVTSYKNMEQVFQEERKYLHDFLDYAPIGLYIFDKDYTLEYANHAFAEMLGVDREFLYQNNFKSLMSDNSEVPPTSAKWNGSIHLVGKKKKVIECFVSQDSFRHNQEIKVRGTITNNLPTDKDLEDKLEQSMDKISWLFNSAPVGIVFIDKKGTILNSNTSAQTLFNQDKLNEQSIFDYLGEDNKSILKKEFQNISVSKTESKSLDINITPDKTIQTYISPMKKFHASKETEVEGLVLYLIDATKQKNLELQFAQAQKMQAMGQLAGGVAHDFNNLLTAMIGFCDLLLQRHGVGDPSFEDLHQIRQNANRAAGLVRQLLAFSRKQSLKPELIDVTENFVELSHLLKRVLGEQIILKFHHGNKLGFIRVDPTQFSQVIINLAVNAKDAMNNDGVLNITTRVESLYEPYKFGEETIKPGEFVVIDVEDNGCGIPKDNLTRIFEPFFSTKQNVVGSGTGLGLSMVYGIVRQTEGFIKIKSEVGKGTTFSIYLPRFDKDSEEVLASDEDTKYVVTDKDGAPILTVEEKISSPVKMDQKLIFGLNVTAIDRGVESGGKNASGIRILFVEDEDSVRAFATRALQKKGYDIVACNSAENALEHLEQDTNFDLLLTDMVMPGISGAELAKIVKEKISDIKVILASGYSEEIARKELTSYSDFEFMAKPFSLGDLTQKVFDVLSKKD